MKTKIMELESDAMRFSDTQLAGMELAKEDVCKKFDEFLENNKDVKIYSTSLERYFTGYVENFNGWKIVILYRE